MSTEQENQSARVPDSVKPQVTRKDGKPTREQRKLASRAQRGLIQVEEIARTGTYPQGFIKAHPERPPEDGETPVPTARERLEQLKLSRDPSGRLGRPSEYTDEEADLICAWIQEGGSLRAYVRATGRTSVTIYAWMRQNPLFMSRYSQAHEDRADTLTDEMIDIADEAGKAPSIEGVAAAKLRVETRRWIATKLRPSKYGDKQIIEQTGSVSIRLGIPQKPTVEMVEEVPKPRLVSENTGFDQALKPRLAGKQAKTPRLDGLGIRTVE